jgi:hypothetical protein
MQIILGGAALPKYTELNRLNISNESDILSMRGTLYTDWINQRRSWVVKWNLLSITEYTAIRTMYNNQYTTGVFKMLSIPSLSIYVPVKIEIANSENIKYTGNFIEDFSIIMKEQYAFS